MSASESVLNHNVKAIALLRDGETAASVDTLRRAIEELKASFDECPASWELEGQPRIARPPLRSIRVIDEEAALENSTENNELFDLFPRAFQLPSGASNQRTVVALLYNLALTYDIQSLLTTDKTIIQNCQTHALNLYTSALRVVSSSWDSTDASEMKCLVVAIVNNLGRLQSLRLSFVDTTKMMKLAMDLLNAPEARDQMGEDDHFALCSSLAPFMCLGESLLTVAPSA